MYRQHEEVPKRGSQKDEIQGGQHSVGQEPIQENANCFKTYEDASQNGANLVEMAGMQSGFMNSRAMAQNYTVDCAVLAANIAAEMDSINVLNLVDEAKSLLDMDCPLPDLEWDSDVDGDGKSDCGDTQATFDLNVNHLSPTNSSASIELLNESDSDIQIIEP